MLPHDKFTICNQGYFSWACKFTASSNAHVLEMKLKILDKLHSAFLSASFDCILQLSGPQCSCNGVKNPHRHMFFLCFPV